MRGEAEEEEASQERKEGTDQDARVENRDE